MPKASGHARHTFKVALLGATLLTGFAGIANAQDAAQETVQNAAPAAAPADDNTVVVVTGYRGSLLNSTSAKKRATGFEDRSFPKTWASFRIPTWRNRSTASPASPSPAKSLAKAQPSPFAAWAPASQRCC
ncbi:MAG: hypothetical protein NVV72_03810 [Asticcacaulis sp.]|nr:hypothetical protein [Asticcacaulis sp.]